MHTRHAAPPPPSEPAGRWEGLVMVLLGAAAGYFCLYPAWALMHSGQPGVFLGKYEMMGIGITPIALGYGLIYLLGGPWAVVKFGPLHKPTRLGHLAGLVLMIVGVALFAWIGHALKPPG